MVADSKMKKMRLTFDGGARPFLSSFFFAPCTQKHENGNWTIKPQANAGACGWYSDSACDRANTARMVTSTKASTSLRYFKYDRQVLRVLSFFLPSMQQFLRASYHSASWTSSWSSLPICSRTMLLSMCFRQKYQPNRAFIKACIREKCKSCAALRRMCRSAYGRGTSRERSACTRTSAQMTKSRSRMRFCSYSYTHSSGAHTRSILWQRRWRKRFIRDNPCRSHRGRCRCNAITVLGREQFFIEYGPPRSNFVGER